MDPNGYMERLTHHAPRPGIQKFFEEIEKADRNGKPPTIFLEAPTSYGKTEASIALAAWLVKESSLAERLIHILPFRAIVEESYDIAKSSLEQHLPEVTVGAQAMHLLDAEKSPFFLSRLVYTTIDSFIYNLFKLPVAEPERDYSHFDIPRYAIYSAFPVFDEAHYFAGDDPAFRDIIDHQNRMFAAFRAGLGALAQGGVPIAVITATMPSSFKRAVGEASNAPNREAVHIKVGLSEYERSGNGYREISIKDLDFFEERKNLETLTRFINETDILRIVEEHHSCGDNVLIVRNTVKKASETYQQFKDKSDVNTLLVHGRMTFGDKKRVLNEARSRIFRKKCVLISTQVIEAGVNLDFDVIVTDASPMANLIQRIGRVGRRVRGQPRNFYAYLLEGDGDGVYEKELTNKSIQVLKDISAHQGEEFYVGWRMPERTIINNRKVPGFITILENTYHNWNINWDKKLSSTLSEIDRYWQIDPKYIREYSRVMCSLLRTSGVISLAVIEEDIKTLRNLTISNLWRKIIDNLVTVDLSWLIRRWKDILDLDLEKGLVRYISIHENGDDIGIYIEESMELFNLFKEGVYNCTILNKLNQFLKMRSSRSSHPVALKVSKDAYTARGLLT